ncbi:hypothetical protein C8J30_101559 [Rhodobacter viridis]|uniref:Uncharacterized protein n=1 Tax=Rhodobacter viridis TaxID=1054202 RepID=A0A318U3M3_9RHOB|nr:hypothetical protein C8J30_101559 [Rhodobacter viridis]
MHKATRRNGGFADLLRCRFSGWQITPSTAAPLQPSRGSEDLDRHRPPPRPAPKVGPRTDTKSLSFGERESAQISPRFFREHSLVVPFAPLFRTYRAQIVSRAVSAPQENTGHFTKICPVYRELTMTRWGRHRSSSPPGPASVSTCSTMPPRRRFRTMINLGAWPEQFQTPDCSANATKVTETAALFAAQKIAPRITFC